MERRYNVLQEHKVQSIHSYHQEIYAPAKAHVERMKEKGKDVSERESDRPLRDLKKRDLRADFDRQQRLKKGAGQTSIAYYDVNSGMEERAHFGYDLDDPTQLGYSYKFDH